jgi:hypothetical protein
MGKTFSTGLLTNGIWQDSSNNIGIGAAANASYKLQVTGTTNLTGALSGTSATFSGDLTIDTNTLFVDSTNNRVGIGTTTPATRFELAGGSGNFQIASSGAEVFFTRDGNNDILANAGTSAGIRFGGQQQLRFATGSSLTTRLTIDSTGAATFSGFVGINGSPGTGFPLEAYINSSTAYTTSSRGNVMRLYNSNTSANIFAGIELGGAGPSNDGLAGLNAVVTSAGSAALTFYTRDSNTFAERLRITSGGLVNILSDSTNTTFTGSGALAIKNAASEPFMSWHSNTGTRLGFIQMQSAGTAYFSVQVAQALAFDTNATERMRITSGGNLLVNRTSDLATGSSTSRLVVNGAVNVGSAVGNTSFGSKDDGGLGVYVGSGANAFQVWDDNQFSYPRFIVQRAGNVGIGTSSPSSLLHISGAGTGQMLRIQNTSTVSGDQGPLIQFVSANQVGGQGFESGYIQSIWTAEGNAFGMRFGTKAADANQVERLRITSNGEVAIGRTDGGGGRLGVRGSTSNSAVNAFYVDNSSSTQLFAVRNDGAINLSTFVYGNTVNTSPRTLYIESGTGSLGGISSIRASKKNIQDIENVDWIYQLNPVTFNYRKKDENGNYTDESHDELFYGLIAEDTEPIAHFLVNYNDKEDGSKEMAGIEYMRLITPMLKAIQEQQAQIEELKELIKNK